MSGKTKATLYLEEDLVKRAKESDLNMSEIANNALKQRFGLERETSRQKDLRELLQEVEEDGRLDSFAFKIHCLELDSIRKFDELTLEFQNGLNVIYGPNGSGKSTIIEAIVNAASPGTEEADKEFIKYDCNSGSARLELENPVVFRQFGSGSEYDEGKDGVLLLDTPFAHYDSDYAQEMVKQLTRDIDSQIILTTTQSELADQADNSIRLRSFTEERLKKVQEELEALETDLEMRKEELMEATAVINDIEDEIEKLQASQYRMDSLQEEREDILDSIDELEMEIEDLEAEIESVEDRLERTESEREIGRLEERRKNLSEQLQHKKERLSQYQEQLEEIEEELNDQKESSEKLKELRSRLDHKRNLRHKLEEEIEELHEEVEVLREEKTEIEEKMEVAR